MTSATLAVDVHGDAGERRAVVFLHGLLGSRHVWRSFVPRVLSACPGWFGVAVDLRGHGDSNRGGEPHDLASVARDVEQAVASYPVAAVVGHSFGGKIALELARAGPSHRRIVVVDGQPGPLLDSQAQALLRQVDVFAGAPLPFARRDELTRSLGAVGVDERTAAWMASNLRRLADGTFTWKIAWDVIADLARAYARADCWPLLSSRVGPHVTWVLAGRDSVLRPDEKTRLERLGDEGVIDLVAVEGAGHWVHIDEPERLAAIVAHELERCGG